MAALSLLTALFVANVALFTGTVIMALFTAAKLVETKEEKKF